MPNIQRTISKAVKSADRAQILMGDGSKLDRWKDICAHLADCRMALHVLKGQVTELEAKVYGPGGAGHDAGDE